MRRRMESKNVENPGQRRERGPALDRSGEAFPVGDSEWVAAVRQRLLVWYADAGRNLPWRASRDAYRILVSEMMLVQTTVAAVIPFFERFIARFPDAAALAAPMKPMSSKPGKAWAITAAHASSMRPRRRSCATTQA